MTLRFHGHPLSSFCWKALTALYEDGAEFEFVQVDLADPESAARFRRISPLGMMPALEDAEAGRVVLESSLVIEHLDLRRGAARFLPADPAAAQEVRFWDRFYDLYVQGPMQRIVADRLRPAAARDPFGVARAREQLRAAYAHAEGVMVGRTWAAGEAFTLADCAAAPALVYGEKVEPFTPAHPALAAYLARLEARPSFARVLAEAEPYAHMFPTG
ncbi:glutathione S-transferase family protein [Phenylobacterium sp.]|uniref:glutathione S-transferase family protein n=1 Tax=Phenylobacterium sp. TaxID=1871053 RepID=UPI00301D56F3